MKPGDLLLVMPPGAAGVLARLEAEYPGRPREELVVLALEGLLAAGPSGTTAELPPSPLAERPRDMPPARLGGGAARAGDAALLDDQFGTEPPTAELLVANDRIAALSQELSESKGRLAQAYATLSCTQQQLKDSRRQLESAGGRAAEAAERAEGRIAMLHIQANDRSWDSAIEAAKAARETPYQVLPDSVLQLVATKASPHWRGVLRLVSKEVREGVLSTEGRTSRSTLRYIDMCCSREMLSWAHWAGMPWDSRLAEATVRAGRLDLLLWAVERGAPLTQEIVCEAIRTRNAELLRWLVGRQGCQKGEAAVLEAAAAGVPWMKMLLGAGWRMPNVTKMAYGAARAGRQDSIAWLLHKLGPGRGQVLDNFKACEGAAEGGHLELLQWLRAQQFRWDWTTPRAAAEGGHIEVLSYAFQNGCQRGKSTYGGAIKAGQLAALQFIHGSMCPGWSKAEFLRLAVEAGHAHLVDWIRTIP